MLTCHQQGHYFYITDLFPAVLANLLSARSLFLYYTPIPRGPCWPVISEVIISILPTCSPQSLLTCPQRGHYFYITHLFSAILANLSSARSLFLYYTPVLHGPCWPVISEVIISILPTCSPRSLLTCRQRGHYFYTTHLFPAVLADLSSAKSLFLYYTPVSLSLCWPVVSEVIISILPTCSPRSLLTCH